MPDLDLIKQGEQGVRVRRYRIFDHLKTHRHCEPLGRRDAPPEDRLREAILSPRYRPWCAAQRGPRPGPGCGGTATVSNRGVFPRVEQGSGAAFHLTPEQLPGLSPAVARRG